MSISEEVIPGEIIIYEAPDGTVELDVRLERNTLWLSMNQLATLLDRDKSVISRHLNKIFRGGELNRRATVAKNATVQIEGGREVKRETEYFNLDAIISVGYRVNSKRGTQFRMWATRVLRDHILQGYTVHKARLRDLNQAIKLVTDTVKHRDLSGDEAKALLAVVGDYSRAFNLLNEYDQQRVSKPKTAGKVVHPLTYEEALHIVGQLRDQFSESSVFGVEKDKGLAAALGAVMQSAGGQDVYPSLEEKAAHLLYFLIKNHAFVDGNKRIAAALFLWFLDKNHALDKKVISDGALVSITLMIAESRPDEREPMVRIIMHLICNGDAAA